MTYSDTLLRNYSIFPDSYPNINFLEHIYCFWFKFYLSKLKLAYICKTAYGDTLSIASLTD